MSIAIYTYHDPYKIDSEPYWKEISNCPYYCVAQTLVNGLRKHYRGKYDGDRVTTVKRITTALFEEWESPAYMVKQHADIDNIIRNRLQESQEIANVDKVASALLFNREEVFKSIRTLFELNVDPGSIQYDKLNKEQELIVNIYKEISLSKMKGDFILKQGLSESEVDQGIVNAMNWRNNGYDYSGVDVSKVVIHGVHQFTPLMLRAIDELQKYKKVILLFNYQKQYSNVYQTWFDIYSAFECEIQDFDRAEFIPSDPSTVSFHGNKLADQLGHLINGNRKEIPADQQYELLEFDNMTEFADYAAGIFESAKRVDPTRPMHAMREQIYAADSSANDILKIYFPEQFGERQFLNYPIGHFFVAIANMWDTENNEMLITDINDVRECLNAGILKEDTPGELVSTFGRIESLFDGCTTLREMRKRIKSVKKSKKYLSDPVIQEGISHVAYYSIDVKELDKLDRAFEELGDLSEHFYEDFESRPHNFREFYRKLKNYLQTEVLEDREVSDEFADILRRVLKRLSEVDEIDASASFECLKATMSIYLLQEAKIEKSADWIIRNFEQIDGDILRSGHEDPNIIYHFACLEDEDIGSLKKAEYPWPLNDDFFVLAQNPIDWKYQVYVKCCNEYKNFKRYALVFGLEFNRAKFKLSYVRRNGDREREPYYLLQILGVKTKKYRKSSHNRTSEDTSDLAIPKGSPSPFDEHDCHRFRICKYKFLMETLVENNTVYKDNFLLLKFLEVMMENAVREEMQGVPISEAIIISKLDEAYECLKKYFPFVRNVNRIDAINTIRNRLTKGKSKKFPILTPEERRDMMLRELFIFKSLGDSKGDQDSPVLYQFPVLPNEKVRELLSEDNLHGTKYSVNVYDWCEYCSNKLICAAYYSKKRN